MTNSVQILAISDDTDVRNAINTSFGVDSSGVMFVSSHAEALQLLNRGVVVDVFLYDASSNKSQDVLFAVDLLRHLASEKLCILSESGDTFWHSYAEKWPIKKFSQSHCAARIWRTSPRSESLHETCRPATRPPPQISIWKSWKTTASSSPPHLR